jgi:threonine/homoserine/homoserine lactone efflux protein
MLSETIGNLLVSAAAVALSPIPMIAIVVVLGTPRARTVGPAFALGWIVGIAAAATASVILLGDADDPDSATATGINWVDVGIGVIFLGMAAKQWRKRPRAGEALETPGWMASLDTLTVSRAVVLGLALSAANPKNLALTFTAAGSIAAAGLSGADTALAVAIFVIVGSITVAGAVVAYLIDSERASRPLDAIKGFMAAHNAVIMMVILVLLGLKLLGNGLGGLWA